MTRFYDKELAVMCYYNIHTDKVSDTYWEVRTNETNELVAVFNNFEDVMNFYKNIYRLHNAVFKTQLESPGFDFQDTEEERKKHPKFCYIVKELLEEKGRSC